MILAVSFEAKDPHRKIISETLDNIADIRYLTDLKAAELHEILSRTDVLLARNTAKELRPEELPLLRQARLIQFLSAGIDYIPLNNLPPGIPLAGNGGAYAQQMAEDALAMALAAAKRLLIEHQNLSRGQFNQFTPNKVLSGKICGFFGFGGYGVATARLMRCLGMRIHAINRRGAADDPGDWIRRADWVHELLGASG